jgi:hypothetical protein
MMVSRIATTVVLGGIFVGIFVAGHLMDQKLSDLGSAPALATGPKFKVEYGSYPEDRRIQCGRNLCPTEQVEVLKLKIQSLNDEPILVKNVVVNDNEECSANPLAKLAGALKSEGRDPGVLGQVPATSSVTATMKYGDVAEVPLFGCEPVRVRIITDRGEKVYELE